MFTSPPIRAILHKSDTSGRLLKWAVELSEFDIECRPRTAIKGQVLADFIVERNRKKEANNKKWVLETDGSSRAQGGGAGIILKSSNELTIAQAIKLVFTVSNNETEYEAIILGLTVVEYLSIENIDIRCDSQLVAVQLRGEYEAKNERMKQYLQIAKPMLASFKLIEVTDRTK